jgi:uncharacterized protein YukE
MVDILVRPVELRQTTSQMRGSAKKIGRALQSIDSDIQSLKGTIFLGNRANAVQAHYQTKRDALQKAADLVAVFATDLETAANVFEQADKSVSPETPSTTTNSAGTSSNFSFPQWAEDALKWIKEGEVLDDIALLAVIRNGDSFTDQIKILGSHWYSKYMLDLPENLRSIKANTLVNNMAADSLKVTKWSTAFTLVKLAADVVPDWFKYTDTSHRGAAVATDALIAAASLGASYQGTLAGAAIGSAIFPGVGTVVGGVVGGLLAGWATDHVLTSPVSTLISDAGSMAGGGIGNSILPGLGGMIGWRLGGEGGQLVSGMLSPEITQVSIKDVFIEGTAGFINNAGEFIGNQIADRMYPQTSW